MNEYLNRAGWRRWGHGCRGTGETFPETRQDVILWQTYVTEGEVHIQFRAGQEAARRDEVRQEVAAAEERISS